MLKKIVNTTLAVLTVLVFTIGNLLNAEQDNRSRNVIFIDYKNEQFYSNDYGVNWIKVGEHIRSKEATLTDYKGDQFYSNDYGVNWEFLENSSNTDIEQAEFFEVKIYPNPAFNYITVQLEKPFEKTIVEIYDGLGKQIFNSDFQNQQSFKVDLNNSVITGTYYLVMNIDGKITTTKFAVVK